MRYFLSLLIFIPFHLVHANDLGVQELSPSAIGVNPYTSFYGLKHELYSTAPAAKDGLDCEEQQGTFTGHFLNTPFVLNTKNCFDLGYEAQDPFEKHIKVCECLSNGTQIAPLTLSEDDLETPIGLVNSNEFSLDHLRSIMNDLDIKSNARNNALILQTHVLGEKISNSYGHTAEAVKDKSFMDAYKKSLVSSLQQQIISSPEKKIEFEKNVHNIMNSMEERPSVLNVLAEKDIKGEGCLPFKNYLTLASYPEENNFWEAMKESFKGSDWNIEQLEKDFLSSQTSPEGKELIKERIIFLEKNPLVKYVFMSGDEAAAKEIHQVMQKHMTKISPSCGQEMVSCYKQFLENGLDGYMKEIANVLDNEKMKAAVTRGKEKESEKYLASLIEKSQKRNSIASLNQWSSSKLGLDLDNCIAVAGQNRFSYGIPYTLGYAYETREMYKDTCLELMPKYCSKVHKNRNDSELEKGRLSNQISGKEDESLLSQIYQDISNEMIPDLIQNTRYDSDRALYCEKHFRYVNGRSLNLDSFTKKLCQTKSPDAACSSKTELMAKFMAYPEDHKKNSEEYSSSNDGFVSMKAIADLAEIREMNKEEVKRYSSITSVTSWLNDRKDSRLSDQNKNSVSSWLASNTEAVSINAGAASTSSSHNSMTNMRSNSQNNMNSFQFTASQIKEQKDELDKEIRDTKSALDYNQERAARPNVTPEFKNEVDVRIASLEKILAEKERTSQEYQNIIDRLMNQGKEAETQLAQSKSQPKIEELTPAETVSGVRQTGKSSLAANSKPETTEDAHRAPASVSENFSTSGGGSGGSFSSSAGAGTVAAGSLGAASGAQARINTALLSKYGITVQDNNANVQVAADREQSQISPLLSDAKQQDMGLEVTRSEFEKFKKHDITALTDLYSKKIEMINSDVVRLMIHTEGVKTPLEFYAIKEKGKVVFQPVRKSKLTDLQNALIQ